MPKPVLHRFSIIFCLILFELFFRKIIISMTKNLTSGSVYCLESNNNNKKITAYLAFAN